MNNSSKPAKDYKLSIERLPFGWLCVSVIVATIILLAFATVAWRDSILERGVQIKSNSSYYSSLARIAAMNEAKDRGQITFMGSSITGRIPGEESGRKGYFNMGVESSGALEGINYALHDVIPITQYIAIELNTLFSEKEFLHSDYNQLIKLNRIYPHVPMINPLYRTSTFLYSELRNERSPWNNDVWPLLPQPKNYHIKDAVERRELSLHVIDALRQFQQKTGCKFIFVVYPRTDIIGATQPDSTCVILAKEFNAPYIDFTYQLPSFIQVHYSDAIHMKSLDAQKAANTVYQEALRFYSTPSPAESTSVL